MWDAVAPVEGGYDPIVYEGCSEAIVSIFNAGPGTLRVAAWGEPVERDFAYNPEISIELRPGGQRVVSGHLIRAGMSQRSESSPFAAIGWRILNQGQFR